ncbi:MULTISPECIES: TlpA family protein disulfide reductase [Bacillaceae]|uniref:TlpA family protein disulfide reductase n=1 Tax=Evansella alkalicola TaxID=745819 RepID=A0ABS6JU64_9BACI|nr:MULTISPECIES: TlpA disulfide reductase family protein [Bacillaceae]MBU9721792.1 TlpA family protein disulfide reductase [Bacillus alkalicola]
MSIKGKMQLGIMFFILFFAGAFYMQSEHELAISQRSVTEVEEGLKPGDKAPNFSLQALSGEQVSLENIHEGKTILFFFTTWCEVCSEQWEQLEWAKNKGMLDDVQIVGVNLAKDERNRGDIEHYVENIPFKEVLVLIDSDGEVKDLYQIFGIPTNVLIDESGLIYSRIHGIIPMEKLENDDYFQMN